MILCIEEANDSNKLLISFCKKKDAFNFKKCIVNVYCTVKKKLDIFVREESKFPMEKVSCF